MNLAAVQSAYARSLATKQGPGELVTLVRQNDAGNYSVAAWPTVGFAPSELAGGVQQGRRMALVLAADVIASGFPLPIKPKSDRLVWGGKTNVVGRVVVRRFQGVDVAYELDIEGA